MIDSVRFANLPEMAKVLALSENGRPDDGRFEIILIPHRPKRRVLVTALSAATRGLGRQPTAKRYRFTVLTAMPLQIDVTTPAERRCAGAVRPVRGGRAELSGEISSIPIYFVASQPSVVASATCWPPATSESAERRLIQAGASSDPGSREAPPGQAESLEMKGFQKPCRIAKFVRTCAYSP